MTTTPVAVYSYDSTGRLYQEWDPRIATPTSDTDPAVGVLTSSVDRAAQLTNADSFKPVS